MTQLFALRKGRTEALVNHGSGWIRMDVLVPARGLIGFRTEFLTETRGTGILHHVFERFEPWFGELRTRPTGALVADRSGKTTSYAILNLQERGSLFVAPGVDVYEGMIVGENARPDDLDVNATKEKKLTNTRAASADTTVRLIPPRPLSLDLALEYIREDECVEVTPNAHTHAKSRAVGAKAADRREPQVARPRARLAGFPDRRDRPELVQPVDTGERGEQPPPDAGDDDRRDAAEHDGRNGADQRRRDAGLEGAELVRRADEDHLHGVHAPAELVGRDERQDRRRRTTLTMSNAAADSEREHREPHRAREPEDDHARRRSLRRRRTASGPPRGGSGSGRWTTP